MSFHALTRPACSGTKCHRKPLWCRRFCAFYSAGMVVPERACGRNFLDWTYPHSMGIGRSGGRRRILKQRKPWTPHLEHALKCAVFLHGSLYSPFAVLCCVGLCRIWKLCIACFDTTGGSAEARGPGSSRSFAALWPQVAGSLWWCIQISTPRPPGALHCVNSGLWHATSARVVFCPCFFCENMRFATAGAHF